MDRALQRKIEVLIRSQYPIPPDYEVVLGERSPSAMDGYDNLPVTFVKAGKETPSSFLLSRDGRTLARLQKFDLDNNPGLKIDVSERPVRGNPDALVAIVNFDDLQCPYCAVMNSELARDTLKRYRGTVKIVYKDFPVEEIHPWATHAAVDANCLGQLNPAAYWAFVDYVHDNVQKITGTEPDKAKSWIALDVAAIAAGSENKVDTAKLTECLKKQDRTVVDESVKLGNSLLIDGTPQVFVAGERLPNGAVRSDLLWLAIDRALKANGIEPPAAPDPAKNPVAFQP